MVMVIVMVSIDKPGAAAQVAGVVRMVVEAPPPGESSQPGCHPALLVFLNNLELKQLRVTHVILG